jgi:hypothetical protein
MEYRRVCVCSREVSVCKVGFRGVHPLPVPGRLGEAALGQAAEELVSDVLTI